MIINKQIKVLLAIFLVGTLSACKDDISLHTQASAKTQVSADEYMVFVDFKHKGENQKKLLAKLLKKTEAFVGWAHKQFSQQQLSADNMNLQPVYEYPDNKPRQIVAYQVSQGFKISGLSFKQYNELLPQLPAFNAHAFGQSGLKVSEQQTLSARTKLVSEAFSKNQRKANHLAQLSGLCELTVLEVKEFDQDGGQPRMMLMKAKAGSSAPSKQSLSVRLDIKWRANPC